MVNTYLIWDVTFYQNPVKSPQEILANTFPHFPFRDSFNYPGFCVNICPSLPFSKFCYHIYVSLNNPV